MLLRVPDPVKQHLLALIERVYTQRADSPLLLRLSDQEQAAAPWQCINIPY